MLLTLINTSLVIVAAVVLSLVVAILMVVGLELMACLALGHCEALRSSLCWLRAMTPSFYRSAAAPRRGYGNLMEQ